MANLNKVCRMARKSQWNKIIRQTIASWNSMQTTHYSTKQPADEEDIEPVKFSTSKAATWKAKQTRSGGRDDDAPPYQHIVVSLSLAVFLLYFCVLREENDLDEEIGRSLFDRVEGLKAKQLEIVLKYNQDHGLPTEDLERELRALEVDTK